MEGRSQYFPVEVIGWIAIGVVGAKLVYNCSAFIYTTYLAAAFRLNIKPKKFGSWAVVTGATDGIGKAYAFKLASFGLNVVLISRTEEKLERVASEILQAHPNVEVKVIAVDFTQGMQIYPKLKNELENLEIGILVNNVGMIVAFGKPFSAIENESEILDIVNCNIISVTNLTHIVLPGMLQRKKGIIMNVSSIAGTAVMPYAAMYGSTKAFVDKFSCALAIECADKGIIVQCVLPGLVATKMSKVDDSSFLTPDPKQYVEASFRTLGIETRSAAFWYHRIMFYFGELMYYFFPGLTGILTKQYMLSASKRMN